MISQEQIKRWNDYFQSLSPEEKRVAIANDVIANINTQHIRPQKGGYFGGLAEHNDLDIQSNFDIVSCEVCALGGLALSLIKYIDGATFDDILTEPIGLLRGLLPYFSLQQLHYIECIFECHNWNGDVSFAATDRFGYTPTDEDSQLIDESIPLYSDMTSKQRMKKIMNNIARNNGEFKPLEGVEE